MEGAKEGRAWQRGRAGSGAAPFAAMTYVRAGTVQEEPGLVARVMDLPMAIYRFLLFFVMTLIDVSTPLSPGRPTVLTAL